VLWEFNRVLPEKPCQTGTFAKPTLLIFTYSSYGNHLRHLTAGTIRSSRGSSAACVNTRGSVRRERLRSDGQTGSIPPEQNDEDWPPKNLLIQPVKSH
jgi:hypothetical protein